MLLSCYYYLINLGTNCPYATYQNSGIHSLNEDKYDVIVFLEWWAHLDVAVIEHCNDVYHLSQ